MAAVRQIVLVLLVVTIPLLINTEILALPFPVSTIQRIFAVSQTSGLSKTEVEKVTRSTLRYLRQRRPDQHLLVSYTAREIVHLEEARVRFWQSRLALVILMTIGTLGYWRCRWSKSSIVLALRLAIIINIILGLLFLLIFTPGTYMFLPDDLLIRLFPYEFWWVMFSLVTLLSDIELGILWRWWRISQ
jgi:hypothetical protein